MSIIIKPPSIDGSFKSSLIILDMLLVNNMSSIIKRLCNISSHLVSGRVNNQWLAKLPKLPLKKQLDVTEMISHQKECPKDEDHSCESACGQHRR